MMTTEELKLLLEAAVNDNPEFEKMIMRSLPDPYGISMLNLASLLLVFHMCKDAEYGRSWAKRGQTGVYHNVMRKVDRLDTLGKLAMLSDDNRVSPALIDTLADFAVYCMMWICYITKTDPQHTETWLRDVWCKTTNIPYDCISDMIVENSV